MTAQTPAPAGADPGVSPPRTEPGGSPPRTDPGGTPPAADRLVLLASTSRVPPGLLSWPAWQELHAAAAVCTATADSPQLPALAAAGIAVQVLREEDPAALARAVRGQAAGGRTAVWLAGPGGDPEVARALGMLAARDGGFELEVVYGSYDTPGARLLDLVAIVDRLRSPGGCPWDAVQTHASLVKHLLEEAYETVEAIEADDPVALREELGDLLLQVVVHARIAEEGDAPWSVDDVAGGVVDKLVGRHPHVFGDATAATAAEVEVNWETLKAVEKGRTSVTEGVPMGQPALALAAKLQKRATGLGLPAAVTAGPAESLPAAVGASAVEVAPGSVDAVGEMLFAAVALARASDVDPEAALRGAARRFRTRLLEVETELREDGVSAADVDPLEWQERWAAAGEAVAASGEGVDVAGDADPGLDEEPEALLERHHEP